MVKYPLYSRNLTRHVKIRALFTVLCVVRNLVKPSFIKSVENTRPAQSIEQKVLL